MTLTEFLLARIAEDEATARTAAADTDGAGEVRGERWNVIEIDYEGIHVFSRPSGLDKEGGSGVITAHMQRHDPARVLRGCERDRLIVEDHEEWGWVNLSTNEVEGTGKCSRCADWEDGDFDGPPMVAWPCPTLRALAAVYADHPDYRDEWKP